MDKEIKVFVEQLAKAAGDNLLSVILFGSSAAQITKNTGSDINMMIILKTINGINMLGLHGIIKKGINKSRLDPVIITREEYLNSLDVFPVEYLEMKENYKIVFGEDLISGTDIIKENLKHQVEFELRSKLIVMRKVWFNIENDAKAMKLFLVRNAASFGFLAKYSDRILKDEGKAKAALLKTIDKIKSNALKADKKSLNGFYWELHDAAAELTGKIDAI